VENNIKFLDKLIYNNERPKGVPGTESNNLYDLYKTRMSELCKSKEAIGKRTNSND
jgi:hypothetical protein